MLENKLAINGGKPVRNKYLPYGHQWIDEDDINLMKEVLKSDWITQGSKIKEFEEAVAAYVGSKYAVAVSSGTAALHASCFAAGIAQGDEVITTPISFVASSNCILYVGGRPVFADIKVDTYNIDPVEIERKITDKTRAVIPVDFAGRPADLDEILKIAQKYNLITIEDASHALGAEYKVAQKKWIRVGNCIHSDMTVFSFHPIKSITTGEGGIIVTNNKEYYEKLLLFRAHGITKDPNKFVNRDLAFTQNSEIRTQNSNLWYYEMQELGYNYRITDFQCALGISQLKKVDIFLERRREIANQYNDAFKEINELTIPITDSSPEGTARYCQPPIIKSAWHIYTIRLKLDRVGTTRKEIFEALRAENIGVHVHYIPVYYQPYYQELGYRRGICPKAEKYYEEAITLPIFPAMKDEDINDVIKAVKKVIAYYRK